MRQRKLDEILTKERLSYIQSFFLKAIAAINIEWEFRKYIDIKINTIDEGIFKEVSVVIQMWHSPKPNKENIAEVRFSRNSIPFRHWAGNYFDFTLCVELDLTEANIEESFLQIPTKRAHKSYFTFEELTFLDSAVAVAVDKLTEEDYYDDDWEQMEQMMTEEGLFDDDDWRYKKMMEITNLKNGVIDRNALSEINLYLIVDYLVYNVASMVGCLFLNKLTIHHDSRAVHVRLEDCNNWSVKIYSPFIVSSHLCFKIESGEMCCFDFQLTVVELDANFTANELALLDNAAKLIMSELAKMDRIKYLMGKLDSERWGTFFVNSQKLFVRDVVDYWKELADREDKTNHLAIGLYNWENYKKLSGKTS